MTETKVFGKDHIAILEPIRDIIQVENAKTGKSFALFRLKQRIKSKISPLKLVKFKIKDFLSWNNAKKIPKFGKWRYEAC